jgi:hypothetical protein
MLCSLRICIAGLTLSGVLAAQGAGGEEFFEKKIRPVLVSRCYMCHGAQAPRVQGTLLLDSKQGMLTGGNAGPAIKPGDPDRSLLIQALRYDGELKMPPGAPLEPEVVSDFEQWVRMGAPDPRDGEEKVDLLPVGAREHWSLRPPQMPQLPAIRNEEWVRNPIDRFVLTKLEEKGLAPAAEVDKRTLIRRVSYDLTGLPPTWEQVQAFVSDDAADAYEKVVERLLASEQYGEHWARRWMDVARYSDTYDGSRRFAFAYTYRDWLIRVLNEDVPYDDFVRKQIAADLVPGGDARDLAAMGFVTLGRSVPKGEHDMIDDRIDAITRGFLGLSVTCARCHDHKFDPILTREYYALYGVIKNSPEPTEYPLVEDEDPDNPTTRQYRRGMERRLKAIDDFATRRHAELVAEFRSADWLARYIPAADGAAKFSNTEIERLSSERDYNLFVLTRWRDYLNRLRETNDPVFAAWRAYAALDEAAFAKQVAGVKPTGNRLVVERFAGSPPASMKDVAERYGALLAEFDGAEPYAEGEREALRLVLRADEAPTNVKQEDFVKIRGPGGDANIIRALSQAVRNWQAECAYRGLTPRAMAMQDAAEPQAAYVFVRGNHNNPGAEAPRLFLAALSEEPRPFDAGSGRLAVAAAISDRSNPLTARVFVNRVWAWRFGKGIVETTSDFGTRGEPPTHPELLDYLARRFMDEGWSINKLHRWMVLSSTYRQSSVDRPAAREKDPENKLLWRMNRRRLDFEGLRDSLLAVTGRLDSEVGGLPFSLKARPAVPRRTLYAYLERGSLPGEMYTFDFAKPEAHQPERVRTIVPQQALYLMNSPFVAEQAIHLAGRREIDAEQSPEARIRALYRIAYQREPSPSELEWGVEQASTHFSHAGEASDPDPWRYGSGAFNRAAGQVTRFEPFSYFEGNRRQPASLRPQPRYGQLSLSALGGAPGDNPRLMAVRRWQAPRTGAATVTGGFKHSINDERQWSDGVQVWIVHSRHGVLSEAVANNEAFELRAENVEVREGDTIDFVVGPGDDSESDDFEWAPEIRIDSDEWKASEDFREPPARKLGPWARLAQVLLASHEFAFVD